MNVQAVKIQLAKDVLELNSEPVLKHLKAVINAYQTDLWDELTDDQKDSVKRAQIQLSNGEGIPHSKVMKKYKKWITR